MSRPLAWTRGIRLTPEAASVDRSAPLIDRGQQVCDDAIVRILPTGNDLEDQVDGPGAGGLQGLEDSCRVDAPGGVVPRVETPVVIGDPVRLLQLHLDEPAPEVLQPRIWIALRAFGSGHALVADVEAEPPRGVLAIALGEQILDLRHRRRLAHRH